MKGKRRTRGNPLSDYRRIQREIRALFDPFTAKHCPGCTTPCCIKPTRVTPMDVALALGTGHTFPHLGDMDPYSPAVSYAGNRLSENAVTLPMASGDTAPLESCEYLHKGRCTFPDDLRPFGCTTYVCGPMYAHLPEAQIKPIRRLTKQLEEAHVAVLHAMRDAGRMPPEED
jgi:hypothetical protein